MQETPRNAPTSLRELDGRIGEQELDSLIPQQVFDIHKVARSLADDPHLRWLGPHKGAVHLALAALTNDCFDLWAKHRGVPLWRLFLDLTPEEVVSLLDLSYRYQTPQVPGSICDLKSRDPL